MTRATKSGTVSAITNTSLQINTINAFSTEVDIVITANGEGPVTMVAHNRWKASLGTADETHRKLTAIGASSGTMAAASGVSKVSADDTTNKDIYRIQYSKRFQPMDVHNTNDANVSASDIYTETYPTTGNLSLDGSQDAGVVATPQFTVVFNGTPGQNLNVGDTVEQFDSTGAMIAARGTIAAAAQAGANAFMINPTQGTFVDGQGLNNIKITRNLVTLQTIMSGNITSVTSQSLLNAGGQTDRNRRFPATSGILGSVVANVADCAHSPWWQARRTRRATHSTM